jgi:predicted DNA-binding ribbon-helix-helix protein
MRARRRALIRLTVEPITTPADPEGFPVAGHVRIDHRPTTLHLEAALWNALRAIAREQGLTVDQLCSSIAAATAPDASFAQAARYYVFGRIAEQIPDELLPAELRVLRRHGYRRFVQ